MEYFSPRDAIHGVQLRYFPPLPDVIDWLQHTNVALKPGHRKGCPAGNFQAAAEVDTASHRQGAGKTQTIR